MPIVDSSLTLIQRSGVKRKVAREKKKKIIILLNSVDGAKAAGLYEITMPNLFSTTGDDYIEEEEQYLLKPVKTFYDQRKSYPIRSVAACVLDDSLLYLVPDEREPLPQYLKEFQSLPRLPSYCFDVFTKSTEEMLVPSPQARRSEPILAVIVKEGEEEEEEVFALSAAFMGKVEEPRFESLDLLMGVWNGLPTFPAFPDYNTEITGYAVLDNSFILVSFHQQLLNASPCFKITYFSYNVRSKTWREVHIPEDVKVEPLDNEAVALGHDIYTYRPQRKELCVLSCKEASSEAKAAYDLSLGSPSTVRGLTFKEEPRECYSHEKFRKTGAIAIVDNWRLCVVHSLDLGFDDYSFVCGSIIGLDARDSCVTLMSFSRPLLVANDLWLPFIKSCYVVDLE